MANISDKALKTDWVENKYRFNMHLDHRRIITTVTVKQTLNDSRLETDA